ncbi:MAG: hypothetical protein ACQER9_01040 [Nanobdellota archaeon]
MREFVYYSGKAPTDSKFSDDLKKAGRLDIALHTIIGAFFLSNEQRNDIRLHLIFEGPPRGPRHMILEPYLNNDIKLSKKDLLWIIRKLLARCKENKLREVFKGYWIEEKNLLDVLKDFKDKKVFVLDNKGKDIRDCGFSKNDVFVLGDQDGFPKDYRKNMKKNYEFISIGPKMYMASQTLAVVQNEIDRK